MSEKSVSRKNSFRPPPLWFRMLNAGWGALSPAGLRVKLEKDDLIRSARKVTGLYDLGKDFNDTPLDRLLEAMNKEARLHPVGRFISRQRLVSLLSIRLRAEHFFGRYPEILDQQLYPAWIIIGLQRTGTTKLQRLLGRDPAHRVIPGWEVINPLPLEKLRITDYELRIPPSTIHHLPSSIGHRASGIEHRASSIEYRASGLPYPDPHRIKIARMSVNAVKYMSPGFFAIHPLSAEEPEEEVLLLDVSFMSTVAEAMMHVPSYASWLERTDQSEAYAYAVKLLKFLQWVKPAKRWILKTPHHLEFPDLIVRHFGEVRFLWPHRDIYECIPSFMSMVTYNHRMFSSRVDPEKVGRHWVRKAGYMLDKTLAFRAGEDNEKKFTDIDYRELVGDPAGVMTRLYSTEGGLTEELKERFTAFEREHPHRKHGVHRYSLADFGMAETDIDRHTSRYREFLKQLYDRKQTEKLQ